MTAKKREGKYAKYRIYKRPKEGPDKYTLIILNGAHITNGLTQQYTRDNIGSLNGLNSLNE